MQPQPAHDVSSSLLRTALEALVRNGRLPGALAAVVDDKASLQLEVSGTDGDGAQLAKESLAPVASITKLATALTVLCLVDAGQLALDDELARYVPEAASAQPGVTLRRLLSHTAGLPLDLPPGAALYQSGLDWSALVAGCIATPSERPPGQIVQYSNVGYGLLALTVERRTGRSFPAAMHSLVLDPLGVEGYLGEQPGRAVARVADVRSEHAGTSLEPYNSAFWRSLGLPWGGLVTTLEGALALVRAFQEVGQGLLGGKLLLEARSDQTDGLPGGMTPPLIWQRSPWGLGPELRDHKTPHWTPPEASWSSFGHAGSSGCLAWNDPAAGVSWAVIGMRTADNGWLIRHAPAFGLAVLNAAA